MALFRKKRAGGDLQLSSYEAFGQLRLSQFRPDAQPRALSGWEFMDSVWVGEAIGFSEWLRPATDPDVLGSLAIDLDEFPRDRAEQVMQTLGLPLSAGMSVEVVRAVLGEPVEELRFVADRVTYEFVAPGEPEYLVSCTILNSAGLSYVVVMRPQPRDETSF